MKRVIADLWKKYGSVVIKILGIIAIVLFYRCPVKIIWDVDCPGCGLTRACLCALKLDFKSAFEYHPLFLIFGAGMLYFIFYEQIKKCFKISVKLELVVLLVVAALFVAVWLIRIVF